MMVAERTFRALARKVILAPGRGPSGCAGCLVLVWKGVSTVTNVRKASKLMQVISGISGISMFASTAGAVDVCDVTPQNSSYAQKAIGSLSNNCSDNGTPVREVLCFTGSSYETGISMSAGQVRNCNSVLQWRTYAFGSLSGATPSGAFYQAQTIGLNSLGAVINSPISVDNSANGSWGEWTTVAAGSVSIKTKAIYYFT